MTQEEELHHMKLDKIYTAPAVISNGDINMETMGVVKLSIETLWTPL